MRNISLPTNIFRDERIVAIAGEFGNTAQLVVIQLLCEIAAAGYFIEWNTLKQNFYARQFGIETPLLCAIVNRLAEYGYFSREMIEQDHVLTNEDAQRRYFRPRTRRRDISNIPHLIIPLVQWNPKEQPKAEEPKTSTEAAPAQPQMQTELEPAQPKASAQSAESVAGDSVQTGLSMGETVTPNTDKPSQTKKAKKAKAKKPFVVPEYVRQRSGNSRRSVDAKKLFASLKR